MAHFLPDPFRTWAKGARTMGKTFPKMGKVSAVLSLFNGLRRNVGLRNAGSDASIRQRWLTLTLARGQIGYQMTGLYPEGTFGGKYHGRSVR